jgi:hypothetical protein
MLLNITAIIKVSQNIIKQCQSKIMAGRVESPKNINLEIWKNI